MVKVSVPNTNLFRQTVRQLAVCVVLACVGLVCVRGAWSLSRSAEPRADFSSRPTGDEPAGPTADSDGRLRFAVATMVSAEATFSTYNRLVRRVCRDVGRRDASVVRPSYTEVRRALEAGKVDVALVCTGTYVHSLAGYMSRHRKRIGEALDKLSHQRVQRLCAMPLRYEPQAADCKCFAGLTPPEGADAATVLDLAVTFDECLVQLYQQVLQQPVDEEIEELFESLVRAKQRDEIELKKIKAMDYF